MDLVLLVVVALGLAAPGENPGPRPREGEAIVAPAPTRRRTPEASPPGPSLPLDVAEKPLVLSLREREIVCRAHGWTKVRDLLMRLENRSPLMSLELWGDKEVYHLFDEVLFHMRAPRGSYVTLWWLGPDGNLLVVLDNVRIPPERNVTVETGGYIVPPLGTEHWVAIATLEPVPVGCRGEAAMLRHLERRLTLEHGVARWEVISR